jgi:hypothetical protein
MPGIGSPLPAWRMPDTEGACQRFFSQVFSRLNARFSRFGIIVLEWASSWSILVSTNLLSKKMTGIRIWYRRR